MRPRKPGPDYRLTSKKTAQYVEGELRDALKAVRMKNCGVSKEHQEAMRIYLRSWVEGPLLRALAIMQKRYTAQEVIRNMTTGTYERIDYSRVEE